MNMKQIQKGLLLLMACMPALLFAQKQNETYLSYIETWKGVAIQQQADYGIPAAITMAQGLLESAAGQSELAVNARNHFGIKCTSDWFGGVYYYDDDAKDECFRQYYDAMESFKDHSLFLRRSRYATCFEIAIEDYEGWAHRLKQCGYATDPMYPQKLIRLIETYRLDTLTLMSPADVSSLSAPTVRTPQVTKQEPVRVEKGSDKKATVKVESAAIEIKNTAPEEPYVEPLSAYEEKQQFMLAHPMKKCRGVDYVEAREGDTYANVAFRLNMRERALREYNDALGRELKVGDRLYLAPKKIYAPQEKALMWFHPGETLWEISQRECIQISTIYKLNGFEPSLRVFKTRQQIYLAKVKE
jgi:hypothetical protein